MIIDDIKQKMRSYPQSKFAVFIRHGEKSVTQTDYGLITDRAKKEIQSMGELLRELQVPIMIYSSPELRCVQTAKIFNEEISAANNDIVLSSFLGSPGIQIKDNTKFLTLFDRFGTREVYSQWKQGMHRDVMLNREELCMALSSFIERTSKTSKISLFISQSGTLAALGYALGLSDYNIESGEWVPFLDGFVVHI
ncbi:histidine phosphatase family protein [Wohlfahrtiimonas chitiniclastica]|uniref:Histidine phosphatase family protein n=1 Tax=Wohlfahrtiimonas chitiniclastica TaxID=400946 RepID=A0AB35C0E1_9GAMM|nr:histidine phosphatase family protein [Wohlfahrtiimonas chitiniclastica]MBS7825474.1 histidine phosphatase family protein [Wohlfahrtiimonas chitiniclastica]MBS7841093.1 histidine phosphatase family protein [Wohlfahrtiimonas chitiniclastica]